MRLKTTDRSLRRALPRALVPALLGLLLAPHPALPADPFYADLLRQGELALQRGDHGGAARSLRIACFGLLEEPALLAQGLTLLGLAQAGGNDDEGFLATFERLTALEDRFGSYSAAATPTAARAAFEEEVARRVPAERLAGAPVFEALSRVRSETRLAELDPGARRAELERLVAAEPTSARYQTELAELELAEGRARRAVDRLDAVLASEPGHAAARCLRGWASARARQCVTAVADLGICGEAPDDADDAASHLGCLVKLRRWGPAKALFDSLQDPWRADPRIARLGRRIVRAPPGETEETAMGGAGTGAPAVASGPDGTPAPAPAEPPFEVAPPAPHASPSPADLQELERLRGQLRAATRAEDLADVFDDARRLAETRPGWQEAQFLAAEIAYRASRWSEAVAFFRRGGAAEDRALRFYLAVSLYETGEQQAAVRALEEVLPSIERTPFVQSYVDKILGPSGSN